ncbi:MAG: ABC transporter substrate-binding protein [Puniceicoccales bacterium]|nr:ABC transporter substrate-binding protein [Puniceicoccales bacterium]
MAILEILMETIMKRRCAFLLLCLLGAFGVALPLRGASEGVRRKVFIIKIIDHSALDETVRGIRDALAERNVEIREESAKGSTAASTQIAQKFIAQKPAVVVGVGTVAAQSCINYTRLGQNAIRLVYSSVTDPKSAGLADKINITGVSNFVPLEPQLQLFRRIQPGLKRLGILYNPEESNSKAIVDKLRLACEKMGLRLVERRVTQPEAMVSAVEQVAKSPVDALFISNDNTALAALENIISEANKLQVPVYVSDTDAIPLGALAALGPDQYQVGLQTGELVSRILDGESTKNLPPEQVRTTKLFLNAAAAKRLDIALSKELLAEAKEVFQ